MKQARLEALKLACFQGLEGSSAISVAAEYEDYIEHGKKVVAEIVPPKRKILKLQK